MNYIYPLLVLITSTTATTIIIKNQITGTYNINQDSIAIPIAFIAAIFLSLTITHLLQLICNARESDPRCSRLLLAMISALLTITSIAILAGSSLFWYTPDHFFISMLYSLTATVYIYNRLRLSTK